MTAFIGGIPSTPMFTSDGRFTAAWAGWFSNAQVILSDLSNSGTTAQRPTGQPYVGKTYFDTTLGLPIFMKTPATNTWVNAAGAIV